MTPREPLGRLRSDGMRAEAGGLLRLNQVVTLTSLNREDLARLEREGLFPQRRLLHPFPTWEADAVNQWLDERDADLTFAGRQRLEAALAGRFVDEALLVSQAPEFNGEIQAAEQLYENAVAIPHLAHSTSGIYFLWHVGRIVYVGQTRVGLARVLSHVGLKAFDSMTFVRCPVDQLDEAERAYIDAFMPRYNRDPRTRGSRTSA